MLLPKIGRSQLLWTAILLLIGLGLLLHLLPFYLMLVLSITPAVETLQGPALWPETTTFAAWRLVFQLGSEVSDFLPVPFWVYLRNSLVMVLGTLLISLPMTSLAAYTVSKLVPQRWQRVLFTILIGTLLIPQIITLIPSYLLVRNFPVPMLNPPDYLPTLQLWDTYWAFILPNAYNAFSFLLFKGYFDTLPDDLIDVARVDGGGDWQIFRHIILPLSTPVYAVAGWLQFQSLWDAYLWPLVAFASADRIPTSVAIANLMNRFIGAGMTDNAQLNESIRPLLEAGLSWNGLMVLGILQTLPVFIAFLLARNYLLAGIRLQGMR